MHSFSVVETEPAGIGRDPETPRPAIEPGVNAPSQVGNGVRIQGEIHGQQDLFLDGEVTGSVTLPNHKLSIGPKGNVKANIKAKNVVLVGNVEGKIEATERVELRSHCRLLGDVRSPHIMIENGAYIKGTVEVLR